MKRCLASLILAGLVSTGCASSPDSPETSPSDPASSAAAGESSGSSAEPSPDPLPDLTAVAIGDAIAAEIDEVEQVLELTEDNDPNDLIGRPGGYVSGAFIYDNRAEPLDDEPGSD